jgi:hypothetical protein
MRAFAGIGRSLVLAFSVAEDAGRDGEYSAEDAQTNKVSTICQSTTG